MNNAFRRPMTLTDWCFVIGVPTTRAEFEIGQAWGEFATKFTFKQYEQAILNPLDQLIEPMGQSLGLQVLRYPQCRELGRAMRERKGILIYTHCSAEGKLEFRKEMVSFDEFTEQIPMTFEGILDFCACSPIGLDQKIKKSARDCAVAIREEKLSGHAWLLYCARFLAEFFPGPQCYWNALLKVNYLLQGRSAASPPTPP